MYIFHYTVERDLGSEVMSMRLVPVTQIKMNIKSNSRQSKNIIMQGSWNNIHMLWIFMTFHTVLKQQQQQQQTCHRWVGGMFYFVCSS